MLTVMMMIKGDYNVVWQWWNVYWTFQVTDAPRPSVPDNLRVTDERTDRWTEGQAYTPAFLYLSFSLHFCQILYLLHWRLKFSLQSKGIWRDSRIFVIWSEALLWTKTMFRLHLRASFVFFTVLLTCIDAHLKRYNCCDALKENKLSV